MKKKQEGGKIQGGQVFIFSKKIKNDGKVVSSGKGAKTHLETDDYSGTGSVESHTRITNKQSWVKKHVLQIIGTVAAGLILYYIFGIK